MRARAFDCRSVALSPGDCENSQTRQRDLVRIEPRQRRQQSSKQALSGMLLTQVVTLDVIGHGISLSEREAEELRHAAAADAGRSSARRDLSLVLERGLRTKATVALSRAEARELAERLAAGDASTNFALLQEAFLLALA
jgi:hypothetical protein